MRWVRVTSKSRFARTQVMIGHFPAQRNSAILVFCQVEQPVQPAVRNPASPGISYRVTMCVHAPRQFRGVDIGAPGGDSQPARWPGVLTSIADRRVTPRRARVPAVSAPSSIRRAAPRVQYHGVGDDAFPLSPYTEAFSSRRRLDWPARVRLLHRNDSGTVRL